MRLALLYGAYVGHACGGSGGAWRAGVIWPGTPSGAGSTIGPLGYGTGIGPWVTGPWVGSGSGVGGTGTTGGCCTWTMPDAGTYIASRTVITPATVRASRISRSFWVASRAL